jgi:hypothetical protein
LPIENEGRRLSPCPLYEPPFWAKLCRFAAEAESGTAGVPPSQGAFAPNTGGLESATKFAPHAEEACAARRLEAPTGGRAVRCDKLGQRREIAPDQRLFLLASPAFAE